MGRLIMQAKVQGMNEYNASEGSTGAGVGAGPGGRHPGRCRSDQAYWDAGSQEPGVQRLAAEWHRYLREPGRRLPLTVRGGAAVRQPAAGRPRRGRRICSHAAGWSGFYDGYALLHEGSGCSLPERPAGRPGRQAAGDYHRQHLQVRRERYRRHRGGPTRSGWHRWEGAVLRLITS